MSKTVRVDDETYRKLSEYAGELQSKLKRPVSINDAIRYLTRDIPRNNKISDLAGTWNTSEEEIDEIKESLEKGWQRWRYY